ncbi:M24 family metallopeptidase [Algihabitans sp.]|uniref:M24 family metallopeptidase n=1 Tax=Algihabitans sp. TaxID=2821514 RepID=UPI003BA99572
MAFLSTAVWDYRRAGMKALMDRDDLDALAFVSADFVQFATNFNLDVQTWERPVLAVVPRSGDPFCLLNELSTHHFRMAGERDQLWVEEAQFYDEHHSRSNANRLVTNWPQIVADLLREKGLAEARVAVDALPGPLARVSEILPSLELLPRTTDLRELRLVKHPEELVLMRKAAELSDWAQELYRDAIRPGRLVQELDAAMHAKIFEEAAQRFPGEHLEMRGYTLTGPASASPHGNGALTGLRIEEGHGIVNIVIPRLNGLVIENERTFFCGTPNDAQVKAYDAALAANEAAIAAARVGNPVRAIEDAARSEIEAAGYGSEIRHRTGHGMGLMGHEYPEDMAFNERPLMAGEVYSAEPGIYVYGLGGFRIDDTVVVGETPEVLTHSPKDLDSIVLPAA